MERESRILAAWQGGHRESSAIVKQVYTDVSPALHGLAERSVIAHAGEIKEEGKLATD